MKTHKHFSLMTTTPDNTRQPQRKTTTPEDHTRRWLLGKMTLLEDKLTGRQSHWKTKLLNWKVNSLEDDLIGRCPHWKKTSLEDDLNEDILTGRRTCWKIPSMEDTSLENVPTNKKKAYKQNLEFTRFCISDKTNPNPNSWPALLCQWPGCSLY